MSERTGNPYEDVERAVWSELSKRRWFGKHVEDDEIEALESDMKEAIRKALERSESECGAQSWAWDDDETLIVYGTCNLPADHPTGWHQEKRNGGLWAEWRGPVERAPDE